MLEDELADFRARVEEVLRDCGLVAAVEQVRGEASAGRVEERPPGKRRTRISESDLRSDEVRIVELTERELLGRLLDLAEVSVAGSLAVEEALLAQGKELAEDGKVESADVKFSDPELISDNSQVPATSLDDIRGAPGRRAAATRVVEILNEMRALTGVRRGGWLELVPDQRRDVLSWVGQ